MVENMSDTPPQGKHRILITGVSRFLGLRLAKRLENDPSVEALVGVDLEEPRIPIKNLEFIRTDIRSPMIARVLEATKIDRLVHTNISSAPQGLGGRSQMKENNVMGTMQLLAAAQRASRIDKLVMKSSTAVYGSRPGEPSVIPEDYAARDVELGGYGRDCSEAEQSVRDFGRRRRDVGLVILRTQNVVGPTAGTSMARYLSLPVVPTALGFDPRLQLLHEEDAVEALYRAVMGDVTGIFNIASDGVVYLSQALRLLKKPSVPLVVPVATTAAWLLRRFRVLDFPTDQLQLLLYGRVVSTMRAKSQLGFDPRWTSVDALRDLKVHYAEERDPDPALHPSWERELFEHLRRRSSKEKENV